MGELVKAAAFSWKDYHDWTSYRNFIETQMKYGNPLGAVRFEGPRGRNFKVKGSSIIRYLANKEDAD